MGGSGERATYGAAGAAGLGGAVGGGSALGAAGSVHVGFGFVGGFDGVLLGGVEALLCLVGGMCEGREREGEKRGGLR